ncbi:MAG TPA: hypothetical protein VMJ10_15530 [Kofleriaceae bacterium]|nr:hypothetical protein [Kofleriaceae bacterium]
MDFRLNLEQLRAAISRRQHQLVILSVPPPPPPPSSRTTTKRVPRFQLTLAVSASG